MNQPAANVRETKEESFSQQPVGYLDEGNRKCRIPVLLKIINIALLKTTMSNRTTLRIRASRNNE